MMLRRLFFFILIVGLVAAALTVACGDDDNDVKVGDDATDDDDDDDDNDDNDDDDNNDFNAPAGSSVTIIGFEEGLQVPYGCDPDWSVPDPCFNVFRDYCLDTCTGDMINGRFGKYGPTERNAYIDCLNNFDEQTCAEAVCDTQYNAWITACEYDDVAAAARGSFQDVTGICGHLSYIVTAAVEGETPVDDDTPPPLPGVLVCWTPSAGELYRFDDAPSDVPPQDIPYCQDTNEYGRSEVKFRIPLPTFCDVVETFKITADIGIATDSTTITVTVPPPPDAAR